MRGLRGWLLGVLLLIAAWFVAAATPDGEALMTDPFTVTAAVGAPAVGDNLAVNIREIVVSDGVSASGGWQATGTWVVVDLDAWTVRTESPGRIGVAYLVLAHRTIAASERPLTHDSAATILDARLHVDVPQKGSLAFEIPADAVRGTAVLQIAQDNGAGAGDPTLSLEGGSVIELPLSLSDLPTVSGRALTPTDWVDP